MKATDIVTRIRDYQQLFIEDGFIKSAKMFSDAATEIERLRVLLKVFDAHYICEDCAEYAATYLEKCQNPLHQLHDAAWEIEK